VRLLSIAERSVALKERSRNVSMSQYAQKLASTLRTCRVDSDANYGFAREREEKNAKD